MTPVLLRCGDSPQVRIAHAKGRARRGRGAGVGRLGGHGSGARPWHGSSGISLSRNWRRDTARRATRPRRGTSRRSGCRRRGGGARGGRGAGLRAALGGAAGGALQRVRPGGAGRPAAAEWPGGQPQPADRGGAGRFGQAAKTPPEDGGLWSGPKVAAWVRGTAPLAPTLAWGGESTCDSWRGCGLHPPSRGHDIGRRLDSRLAGRSGDTGEGRRERGRYPPPKPHSALTHPYTQYASHSGML
jgi:hypothetical protein